MVEVYTWEPNANSGKLLFYLKEKQVPFTHHYIDTGKYEQFSPEFLAINPDGTMRHRARCSGGRRLPAASVTWGCCRQ